MFSVRSKVTLLNVVGIAVSMATATIIGGFSIAKYGHEVEEEEMVMLCEQAKNNLNGYFKSVEQSVEILVDLVDNDLESVSDADFEAYMPHHLENAKIIFNSEAKRTNGVFTYYYRIDPAVSDEPGFWYVKGENGEFAPHQVSDLTDEDQKYDWFRIPKTTGEPIWLNPYITENLEGDVTVVSYNYPIQRKGSFVGVVGIEINYQTLGDQIKQIKALETGFAFIVSNLDGSIIYHPIYDILNMEEAKRPKIPDEFKDQFSKGKEHIVYKFDGVTKHCCWEKLTDGMSVVVTVPAKEINGTWKPLVTLLILVSAGIVGVAGLVSFLILNRATKALKELTVAAEEINKGNYNVTLNYHGNNEIGVLNDTFNNLITNLDEYISDLNSLAYSDPLTSVGNKQAFDARLKEIQKRIEDKEDNVEFAIAICDCDNLKDINDEFGHEKGDIYLRNSCNFMKRAFKSSVVYRVGGDEFAIILEGDDYKNREALQKRFVTRSAEISSFAKHKWERIRVSIGLATYDPSVDKNAMDVMVHADRIMYVHKRHRKQNYKY